MQYSELVNFAISRGQKSLVNNRANGTFEDGQALFSALLARGVISPRLDGFDFRSIDISHLGVFKEDKEIKPQKKEVVMTPDTVTLLVSSSAKNQDDPNAPVNVVIHLGSGIIVPIRSIGTDGAGTVYIDANCSELDIKYKEG